MGGIYPADNIEPKGGEGYTEGKADGIREVVEWIEDKTLEDSPEFYPLIRRGKWGAKLKEWGL